MIGFIMSIIAGAAMSIQGVLNTELSKKVGLYESNVFVQGTAFLFSLIAFIFLGKGNMLKLGECNKIYLLGGLIGIIITITVMLSIKDLSPSVAISVILISQLLVAAIIDAFGLFGTEKVAFTLNKYIGIGLMVGGIIIFKK